MDKPQTALGHPPDRLVLSVTCAICHNYKGELKKAGDLPVWDTWKDHVERCLRCIVCGREL